MTKSTQQVKLDPRFKEKKSRLFNKQKEYHRIFNQWRDYDFITTILAMIGLALAVANYEIEMLDEFGYSVGSKHSEKQRVIDPDNVQRNLVKAIVAFTSLLAVGCLAMRHYYKILWLNKYFHQDSETHLYYQFNEIIIGQDPTQHMIEKKRFFDRSFFGEFLVLIICPIPYLEVPVPIICKNDVRVMYSLSDFLLALMWMRVFFLIRSIFNYSIYTDAYSKKLCRSYGFSAGVRFTFKCQIIVNPEWTVAIMFTSTILILSYILRIFELPWFRQEPTYLPEFDSYFNSVWCTIITLTTVGYGDIAPGTIPGRVIAMITALWGAFLISLLVVTVSSVFDLSNNQKMALRHIRLTRTAAMTISRAIKYFLARKRYHKIQQDHDPRTADRSVFVSMLRTNQSQAARAGVIQLHNNSMLTQERFTSRQGSFSSAVPVEFENTTSSFENVESNELIIADRIVKLSKKHMLDSLEAFKAESWDLKKMKQERNKENELNNKILRETIIEMSARIEKM